MLLVVTSAFDPALPLLQADPRVTVLVPAHLSQPGIVYQPLRGGDARLSGSRGPLRMQDVEGVVTCIARVGERDLPHVHPDDRAYVAAEMTAFLAALVSELRCPVFNPPTGAHLGGLSWTPQHAWRVAREAGLRACARAACEEVVPVVALDGQPLASTRKLDPERSDTVRRISQRAGVRLLQVDLCGHDGGVHRVSPQPALTPAILEVVFAVCGGGAR
jgi:hypothetical protein